MNIKDIDTYLEKIKNSTLSELGVSPEIASEIILNECPDNKDGYKGFPCYALAKVLRKPPNQVAEDVLTCIEDLRCEDDIIAKMTQVGPYINFHLDPRKQSEIVLGEVFRKGSSFGHKVPKNQNRMMVEFSSPNTNKPLHLGHVRNNVLGDSISKILEAGGNSVQTTNLINDRGIHICQSMLAYQLFGEGETPESTGKKGDHFVGDYYVLFNKKSKEDPSLVEQASDMLEKWEEGDPEVRELWSQMNEWVLDGFQETYRRQLIQFDTVYFESDTYELGKEIVEQALVTGILHRKEDGSIVLDLSKIGEDGEKVLLRSNGTTVYMTQDIGTVCYRFDDHNVSDIFYVVGDKQQYHFKVLTRLMALLKPEMKNRLHHISYGMVDLPDGKMGSRFGNIIKADDLLKGLESLALDGLNSRYPDLGEKELEYRSQIIALAALKFHLLDYNPRTTITFDPEASLSFQGRTGPYCLYSYARIASILRQHEVEIVPKQEFHALRTELEMQVVQTIQRWPFIVKKAASNKDPSEITAYLFRICKAFSSLYNDQDHQITKADPVRKQELLSLAVATQIVIKSGLDLLGIPTLEEM